MTRLGIAWVAVAALLLAAGARADVSRAKASGEPSRLRIGGPLEMAPFAYLDQSGVYTGFSVDLLQSVGQQLGIENVFFYPALPAESLRALAEGEIDCIHSVRYTPELAQKFIFAAFYLESPSLIFVIQERYDLASLQDLLGKRVAVLEDDPAYGVLKRIRQVQLVPVKDIARGFFLLRNGGVDAYVGERLTTMRFLGESNLSGQVKTVGTEVARSRFGVLVRTDEQDLARRLAKGFADVERSGIRERIFNQWFGEKIQPQPPLSRRVLRWVFIFVGGSLLVAMIVLGWNLLLQRELALKAIAIEKAQLDKTIAEEKSRFEAIVQSMTEGLMLVDPQGRIAYLNARGAQYLGRRVEDLLGHPLGVLNEHLLAVAADREVLARKLEYAQQYPSNPLVIEYSAVTTRRQEIRLKLFPVRDRQGEYAGRGLLIEDVTHEREVERLKAEFVSIASHELRTPMTSILGFSELMLTQELPRPLNQRYTEQIHKEAERLTRILNDMLDLSYLESGEGVLEIKQVHFGELINEVVESFQAQLKDRRELKISLAPDTGVLWADRDKLSQVLWNLLSNADKYSPPGKPVGLEVARREQPEPEWNLSRDETALIFPALELRVIDFGQGIPPDHLSLIFTPFHRVETAVHTIRGTGLGLAIVKRIVEAHRGRVWAQSEPGVRTVFTVLLPLRSRAGSQEG